MPPNELSHAEQSSGVTGWEKPHSWQSLFAGGVSNTLSLAQLITSMYIFGDDTSLFLYFISIIFPIFIYLFLERLLICLCFRMFRVSWPVYRWSFFSDLVLCWRSSDWTHWFMFVHSFFSWLREDKYRQPAVMTANLSLPFEVKRGLSINELWQLFRFATQATYPRYQHEIVSVMCIHCFKYTKCSYLNQISLLRTMFWLNLSGLFQILFFARWWVCIC